MSTPRQPPEPNSGVPAWHCAGCRLCHLTPDRQLCRLRHLLRWLDAQPAPSSSPTTAQLHTNYFS